MRGKHFVGEIGYPATGRTGPVRRRQLRALRDYAEKMATSGPRVRGRGQSGRIADRPQFCGMRDEAESRTFIKSFVREVAVAPARPSSGTRLPMPRDSRIRGGDTEEVALMSPVLSTVPYGGR